MNSRFKRNVLKGIDRYFPPVFAFFFLFLLSGKFRHSVISARYFKTVKIDKKSIFYNIISQNERNDILVRIYKEIDKNPDFKDYTHIFSVNDLSELDIRKYRRNSNVKIVKKGSLKANKSFYSSKFYFSTSTLDPFYIKRTEQIFALFSEISLSKEDYFQDDILEINRVSRMIIASDYFIDSEHVFENLKKISRSFELFNGLYINSDSIEEIVDTIFKQNYTPEMVDQVEKRKTKILIFPGPMNANGVTTSFLSLLNVLDYEKHDITVFLSEIERNRDFQARICEKAKVLYQETDNFMTIREYQKALAFRRQGARTSSDIPIDSYGRTIKSIFADTEFDVVINYHGYQPDDAAKLCFGIKSHRKVIYMHNDLDKDRRIKQPQLRSVFSTYQYYDSLFCVSADSLKANLKGMAAYVKSEFGVDLSDKMGFSRNLIEPDKIRLKSKINLDSHFSVPQSGICNFITIGRLSPEKNHKRLFESFKQVKLAHREVCLYVVGDGSLSSELHTFVSEMGLDRAVVFIPFIANPYPLLAACDCFVLSSDIEGQPITILEALTLNKPVIATDIAGPHDLLKDGYGTLVDCSAVALSQSMIEFIVNGKVFNRKIFDAESYVEEVKRDFEEKVLRGKK